MMHEINCCFHRFFHDWLLLKKLNESIKRPVRIYDKAGCALLKLATKTHGAPGY
jgi:hypothetical protein